MYKNWTLERPHFRTINFPTVHRSPSNSAIPACSIKSPIPQLSARWPLSVAKQQENAFVLDGISLNFPTKFASGIPSRLRVLYPHRDRARRDVM